jgi:biotin operon repressor
MKPNYFSILPANVRYAKIPDRAKLLFSEITALSNKEGYCWASNQYFAELYGCSMQAISKQINTLKASGFIRVFIDSSAGNARRIFPVMDVAYQPVVDTPINQELIPYQPVVEYNSISNNTSKNKREAQNEFAPSPPSENLSPVNPKPKKTRTMAGPEILTDPDFRREMADQFPNVPVSRELDKMKDKLKATGKTYKDYAAAARYWLRLSEEFARRDGKQQVTTPSPARVGARSLAELED